MPDPLTLSLDMNLLNHLGIGLYASAPAVLTELVANAWDAEATAVSIDLDFSKKQVITSDDGHGMNGSTIQSKFLTVGYSRRDKEGTDMSRTRAKRMVSPRSLNNELTRRSLSDSKTCRSSAAGRRSVSSRTA